MWLCKRDLVVSMLIKHLIHVTLTLHNHIVHLVPSFGGRWTYCSYPDQKIKQSNETFNHIFSQKFWKKKYLFSPMTEHLACGGKSKVVSTVNGWVAASESDERRRSKRACTSKMGRAKIKRSQDSGIGALGAIDDQIHLTLQGSVGIWLWAFIL
jgi:hypothetical protein